MIASKNEDDSDKQPKEGQSDQRSNHTIASLENLLEKTFTGSLSIKITHARIFKGKLTKKVVSTFKKHDTG